MVSGWGKGSKRAKSWGVDACLVLFYGCGEGNQMRSREEMLGPTEQKNGVGGKR